MGEVQELLTAGVEFPDLGIVKIQAKHPVPGLDRLVASLKEQCATSFVLDLANYWWKRLG